jgi:hypothetical protein
MPFLTIVFATAIAVLLIEYLYLIPEGLVTQETKDIAYWILVLPLQFSMLAIYSLINGELVIGKTKYTIFRYARSTVIVLSLAFLGFVLGHQIGVFVGVIVGIIISSAITYWLKRKSL